MNLKFPILLGRRVAKEQHEVSRQLFSRQVWQMLPQGKVAPLEGVTYLFQVRSAIPPKTGGPLFATRN